MKVYAGALEECCRDDITLIAGDLVPAGTGHHYRMIRELTEALAGSGRMPFCAGSWRKPCRENCWPLSAI